MTYKQTIATTISLLALAFLTNCSEPEALPVMPVSPVGSLSGIVYQDDPCEPSNTGFPSAYTGAAVKIYSGATMLKSTTTDDNGVYRFIDLAAGDYDLIVSFFSYQHDEPVSAVHVEPGEELSTNVTVEFIFDDDIVIATLPIGYDPVSAASLVGACGVLSYVNDATPVVNQYRCELPPGVTLATLQTCLDAHPDVISASYNAFSCP